jgi:hypothetical protein
MLDIKACVGLADVIVKASGPQRWALMPYFQMAAPE